MSLSISLRYCPCKRYASRSMRRIGWCIADIDHWLTQYLLSCIKNSFILHQPLTDWGLVSEFFKYLNPSFATHLNWSHKYQWMLSSGRPAQDYIFRFPVKSQKQLNGLVVYNVLKADMKTMFDNIWKPPCTTAFSESYIQYSERLLLWLFSLLKGSFIQTF